MNSGSDSELVEGQQYLDPNQALCATYGFECNGLGGDPNHLEVGTNPVFHEARYASGTVEGFGCVGGDCDGIDESVSSRWTIKPGSEFVEPELFIPNFDETPVFDAGIGGDFPEEFPTMHVVDPNGGLSEYTIGAVPANPSDSVLQSWISKWNSFPFNQIWTTSTMATAATPVAEITDPSETPFELMCPGGAPYICGARTDTDGGAPYTYLWTFTEEVGGYSGPCPSPKTTLCPGHVTFPYPAECSVRLRVTDRWGKQHTSDAVLVNVLDECARP
jgi:hypothetical protein